MTGIVQDVRYALRGVANTPGFAAAVVLTLALGIGANSAMFSFADATAFRPPDVPRSAEVVRVFGSTKAVPYARHSYPDYVDYRDRTSTLSGVVAYDSALVAMSHAPDEVPQLLGCWVVSGNFFSVLEVQPVLGRAFRKEEDKPGADPVVVISHHLWERQLGSNPAVIGSRIRLSTREFTIIGVAPATFSGTELFFHPDLYVPIAMMREIVSTVPDDMMQNRSYRWLNVLARLNGGVNVPTAQSEVLTLARSLEQAHPETNRDRTTVVLPEVDARGRLDEGGHQGAALSLWIVGLVLLIACVNVANLMLSRSLGRKREIALRLALGASRGRLIRQLLTESVLLALVGGTCGLFVAYGGVQFLSLTLASNFAVTDMPIAMDARIDMRVLWFTLLASLATGLLFGLTPALQSTRPDLVSAIKSSVAGEPRRAFGLRNILVGVEIALAIVVLTIAGIAITGFIDKQRADPGYRTDNVLLMAFNPSLVNYSQPETTRFYEQIVEQTKTLPGVSAVGLGQFIPLGVSNAS